MNLAEEFLSVFNEIEYWLRADISEGPYVTFFAIVDRAAKKSKVVARHKRFLKDMGNLRNVIVHDPKFPKKIIADPRPQVIEEFKRISAAIRNPPKLLSIGTQNPLVYNFSDPISTALPVMRENDYSQIVVQREDCTYGLLTREGVAMWVEANISEDIVSIRDMLISDVLKWEKEKCWSFVSRDTDIFEGLHFFSKIEDRMQALIITHGGKPTETPLGIVTVWDLQGQQIEI